MCADKPNADGSSALAAMQNIARALSREDAELGAYFASVDHDDVLPQRRVRTEFSRHLEASNTTPQVVTVRSRGDNPGGTYVILSVDKVVRMFNARAESRRGETITDRMRQMRREMGVELPPIAVPKSRRRRSTVPRISAVSKG